MYSVLLYCLWTQQLSVFQLPFSSEAFPKFLFRLISFLLSGWGSYLKRKSNPDATSDSILWIAVSEYPPKYKQLDLSEDLKNEMPPPLFPTVATFFMIACGQKQTRLHFYLPPRKIYSVNFARGLLQFPDIFYDNFYTELKGDWKKNATSIQSCQELDIPLTACTHFLFLWFFCKISWIFISSASRSYCFEITPKCFKDLFFHSKNWRLWIVSERRWMGSLGRANKYLDGHSQVKKNGCLHLEAEVWSLHI